MNDLERNAIRSAAQAWRYDSLREEQLQNLAQDAGYFSKLSPIERSALHRYKFGKEAAQAMGTADSEISASITKQQAQSFQLNLDFEAILQEIQQNPGRRYTLGPSQALALGRYEEARAAAQKLGYIK